jgi:DoxX-like protein
MFAATIIVSALLAAALTFSALRKLSHRPVVVEAYGRAGVPEDWLNLLATVLLAGAFGLLAGLAWAPLGIAAAACLVAYFLVAIGFHIRAGDAANVGTPLAIAVLAALALALRLATA